MADFNIEEAKKCLSIIKTESKNIKNYLNSCNELIDENINDSNGWHGQAANDFKMKWQNAEGNFGDFMNLITKCENTLNENIAAQSDYEQKDFV